MPTHCTIMRFGFRARRIDGFESGLFFNHYSITYTQSLHAGVRLGCAYHPPYSPDIAPSDFHLFLQLKKILSGQRQRFQSDKDAEMSVTQWFQSQTGYFYDTGTVKLVPRYDKCLISGGEYFK